MHQVLRKQATVQPGGKIEIVDPDLMVGEQVEVVISSLDTPTHRSAWRIISEGPLARVFESAQEVDECLDEERASWDR